MGTNIALGSLMMIVTTVIHGAFMVLAVRLMDAHHRQPSLHPSLKRWVTVGLIVLAMFAGGLVEVAAWAAAFVLLGAISGAEPALYFSTVTFTTLGYGDVLLDAKWRLLGAFEAANGIIMMGWTTAIVVAAVQRVTTQPAPPQADQQDDQHV